MIGNNNIGMGSLDDVLKDKGITATRDPRRLGEVGKMAVGRGNLHLCEVHDVLAYANSYIVKAAGMPRMPACLLSSTSSFLPLGGRDCATIMPGSLVLCMIDDNIPTAMILGVLPSPMGGNNLGLPDSIVAAGHAGLFTDSTHYGALQQKSGHGFLDLSVGRPVDGLPGDWGFLNELGVGIFVGKLLSFLRAGDFCKFEVNYEDQLARIAAMNFEKFTSGSEEQAFNDEGEWTNIAGFNPYPWEALGMLEMAEPFDTTGAKLTGDNEEFGIEPTDHLQTGMWRFRTMEGFLGDLVRKMVLAPAPGVPLMTFGLEETPYVCLLDERYGVDGSYKLRSAKSISFEKTIYIPTPYEKFSRDHPKGDTDFTDAAGNGADYNMAELPAAESPSDGVAGLLDKHAYESQHLTQEGVNLRTKDWGVQDPPVMPDDWTKETETLKPYSTFESALPASADVAVDHRGNRRYYKSRAYIDILDDGSIVMVDAYGSSISMTGGNIEFSCPGDVINRPGRDLLVISGQDIILKANKDVDITAAAGSVRQKAELNFMILGGNDGSKGGVLIENRAKGTPVFESAGESANVGGLLLKSAAGDVTIWGKQVNLQSLNGDIVLDANESKNDVVLYGRSFKRYLTLEGLEMVSSDGTAETADPRISYYSLGPGGYAVTSSSLRFAGSSMAIMPRDKSSKGGIQLVHFGSAYIRGSYAATKFFGDEAIKEEDAKKTTQSIVNSVSDELTNKNTIAKSIDKSLRGENSTYLGEKSSLKVGVTFRTSEELGISTSFVLYQSDWQRSFELSGGSTKNFEETIVYAFTQRDGATAGTETMPYPGKAAWEDGDHFKSTSKNRYVDIDADGSAPKPRTDSAYDEAQLPEFESKKLKGNYVVNNPMS